MRLIVGFILCACVTLAHADRFAIYLPDVEAGQLVAILQRADLTSDENVDAGRFLPFGLQSWPAAPTVNATCGRTLTNALVRWRRIVVEPQPDDAKVTKENLASLLDRIALHVTDPNERGQVALVTLWVRRCGEVMARR